MHLIDSSRQPGDLEVLREVFRGFSEKARTRGFASPAFAEFAIIRKSIGGGTAVFNAGKY
jgi:hypothetical protein